MQMGFGCQKHVKPASVQSCRQLYVDSHAAIWCISELPSETKHLQKACWALSRARTLGVSMQTMDIVGQSLCFLLVVPGLYQ